MSMETVPKNLRGLRACLVCSLIKTFDQFEYDGCDNCDEFLRMKNNKDNVFDCTSSNFDGLIKSMLMKILYHLDRFCKGVYAISVSGRLPAGVIREMKSRGIGYRSRDTSQR
ncbi:Transcription elongation factor SPT4 [Ooceraea biroi]|uniref:Transcription elongation factor SPT4 n=1 Tax=Ooceraea biroi TaxID=2015173 RepID=A0A026W9M7_OOCBI|nr:Transcription elongation factor SPT4 [Ooceraea biroi]